jgi:hypothetical protein
MKILSALDRLVWFAYGIQNRLLWIALGALVVFAIFMRFVSFPVPCFNEEAVRKLMLP